MIALCPIVAIITATTSRRKSLIARVEALFAVKVVLPSAPTSVPVLISVHHHTACRGVGYSRSNFSATSVAGGPSAGRLHNAFEHSRCFLNSPLKQASVRQQRSELKRWKGDEDAEYPCSLLRRMPPRNEFEQV